MRAPAASAAASPSRSSAKRAVAARQLDLDETAAVLADDREKRRVDGGRDRDRVARSGVREQRELDAAHRVGQHHDRLRVGRPAVRRARATRRAPRARRSDRATGSRGRRPRSRRAGARGSAPRAGSPSPRPTPGSRHRDRRSTWRSAAVAAPRHRGRRGSRARARPRRRLYWSSRKHCTRPQRLAIAILEDRDRDEEGERADRAERRERAADDRPRRRQQGGGDRPGDRERRADRPPASLRDRRRHAAARGARSASVPACAGEPHRATLADLPRERVEARDVRRTRSWRRAVAPRRRNEVRRQQVPEYADTPGPIAGASTVPASVERRIAPRWTTYQTPRHEIIDAIPNDRTSPSSR